MIRRALDLTTGLSIAVCGLALYCWLASATGWKPEGWNLSLPEIQDHVPDRSVLGLTFIGGSKGLGEASVRILRYQPLSNPVDGPPEEYRDELFPFTTWTLRLTKFSDRYGFSSSKEPVFDPTRPRLDGAFDRNTARPRLVGMYEEWGIPYWFIVLVGAILPATRGIRGSIRNHGLPSAVSFAWGITAAAFAFFLIAVYDTGWSGEFELVSSLALAVGGLVTALIAGLRNRTWFPAVLNVAYWGTIFLVHRVNH